MSGSKFIHTQRYGSLKKQKVIIRDNTPSTEVVLWEEYVDCLEMNKTYLLSNIRVKGSKSKKYLNTAKTEKFTFKETGPFTQPGLPEYKAHNKQQSNQHVFLVTK